MTLDLDADEIQYVAAFLDRLDGRTELEAAIEEAGIARSHATAIIDALHQVGAVVDVRDAWSMFHRLSANPMIAPPTSLPETAYRLDRWVPDRFQRAEALPDVDAHLGTAAELALQRSSADVRTMTGNPARSAAVAVAIATEAYRLHDDSRAVPSGGALYPLSLFVIGGVGPARDVVHINHDELRAEIVGAVDVERLRQTFVRDEAVDEAIARGVAIVAISVDMRRTAAKYGNRGYRYALIEVGSVLQQLSLLGVERGAKMRAIGGFFDERLASVLGPESRPVLTVLVSCS